MVAAATRRALTLHARSEPTCGPSSRFGWACAREGVAGARADGWLLASLAPGLARDAPPGHAGHVCVAQRRKRRGCQLDCICGACLGHRRGGSRGLAEAGRRVRWRCGGACAAVEVARGARKGGGRGVVVHGLRSGTRPKLRVKARAATTVQGRVVAWQSAANFPPHPPPL